MRLVSGLLLFLNLVPAFASDTPNVANAGVSRDAPIRIVLDGNDKKDGCSIQGHKLQSELNTLHFPPGWTIAIMCTPARWDTILREADVRNTHAAFTRISERITVLNGDIFRDSPLVYRHIMAHELAHITCNCADEGKVEKLARELENSTRRREPVVGR